MTAVKVKITSANRTSSSVKARLILGILRLLQDRRAGPRVDRQDVHAVLLVDLEPEGRAGAVGVEGHEGMRRGFNEGAAEEDGRTAALRGEETDLQVAVRRGHRKSLRRRAVPDSERLGLVVIAQAHVP